MKGNDLNRRTWYGKLTYPFEKLLKYVAVATLALHFLPGAALRWLRERWPSVYKDGNGPGQDFSPDEPKRDGSTVTDIQNGSTISDFTAADDASQTIVFYEPDSSALEGETVESPEITVRTEDREYQFEYSDLEDLKRFFEGLEIRESE